MKNYLQLIDDSRGKLYLAVQFLSHLNNLAAAKTIWVDQKVAEQYGSFWKLFPNIRIQKPHDSLPDEHFRIHFRELISPENIQPDDRDLIFPIIMKNPDGTTQKWLDEIDIQRYPNIVPPSVKASPAGWIHGELESACDMADRMITEKDLQGIRILISAGATAEDIDPVRYLTNRSTGKMGIALARAAFIRGAEVTLVAGETAQSSPACIHSIRTRSAADMAEAIFRNFVHCDAYIGAAAVADYTPSIVSGDKIKKQGDEVSLNLKRTCDILAELRSRKSSQILVGFSVETRDELENSQLKLQRKGLDFIVINNPKQHGAAFAMDTNLVTIIDANGDIRELPLLPKIDVSHHILNRLLQKIGTRV